jgi:hypothetical protein
MIAFDKANTVDAAKKTLVEIKSASRTKTPAAISEESDAAEVRTERPGRISPTRWKIQNRDGRV